MPESASTTPTHKFFELVAGLLRWSLVISILVMLTAITIQVVGRYVFLRAPSWSEELAVLCFAWGTIGGLALGVREGFHVALTLLIEALPRGGQRFWNRCLSAMTAVLGAFFAWAGLRFLVATSGSYSAAMEYPIEILNVMAPISGVLISLFAIERAVWPLDVRSGT